MNPANKEQYTLHSISAETVCEGVHILNEVPPQPIVSVDVLTAQDFGRAGIDADKTENYGHGVMRDIALRMVGIEAPSRFIVRGTPEFDLYYRIFYIMNNPDMVKQGSRNKLLLDTQLVHDIWRVGEGDTPSRELPQFGKVGHRIISMLFTQ